MTTKQRPSFYPSFYDFPPFWTIQKVAAVREKQMGLWRELILNYCRHYNIHTLKIHSCDLWKHNGNLDRSLNQDEIKAVCNDFCAHGHGEYMDDHTAMRILFQTPEQLATDIYEWAQSHGYNNSVVTLYELHSGEDNHNMSFANLDEDLLKRALAILEQRGQCTLFQGDTSAEDGIKFL